MKVTLVGRGRVGRALRRSLARVDVEVSLRAGGAAKAPAEASVLVLTVPDSCIAEVAARLALSAPRRTIFLHCAGARTASELCSAEARGFDVGVMHPLVSFADSTRGPDLAGASFVIDGTTRAVTAARRIARSLGAHALCEPVHGPAYHAAAALVANGAVALATASVAVLTSLRIEPRAAEGAVAALLRSVADNVSTMGVPDALTGPVARGDAPAVAAHRKALARVDRAALRVYDAVAPAVLDCARSTGLSPSRAQAVRRALRKPVSP